MATLTVTDIDRAAARSAPPLAAGTPITKVVLFDRRLTSESCSTPTRGSVYEPEKSDWLPSLVTSLMALRR